MKLHMIAMLITCMLRLACGKPHPNRCRGSTAEDSIWRSNRSWYAGETLNMVRFLFSGIIHKNRDARQ
jgi:hypothetical protein